MVPLALLVFLFLLIGTPLPLLNLGLPWRVRHDLVTVLRSRFWRFLSKIPKPLHLPNDSFGKGTAGRTLSAQPPACPYTDGSLWRATPTPLLGCSCFFWHCGCWRCSRRLRIPCILLEAWSLWRLCAALQSVCCPPISIRNTSGAFIFPVILIQIASGWFWIQEGNNMLWRKTSRNLRSLLLHPSTC